MPLSWLCSWVEGSGLGRFLLVVFGLVYAPTVTNLYWLSLTELSVIERKNA